MSKSYFADLNESQNSEIQMVCISEVGQGEKFLFEDKEWIASGYYSESGSYCFCIETSDIRFFDDNLEVIDVPINLSPNI